MHCRLFLRVLPDLPLAIFAPVVAAVYLAATLIVPAINPVALAIEAAVNLVALAVEAPVDLIALAVQAIGEPVFTCCVGAI